MKVLAFCLLIVSPVLLAKGVYQQPADFINQTFANSPPKPKVVWITKSLKPDIEKIMAHKVTMLRVRYWNKDKKTAWILEEIGKEKPITVGVVVKQNRINMIKVLEFRESRGDEVRHAFFTDQFNQITLNSDLELSKSIDGVSGATLSVRALTKIGKLALYLNQHTQ